MVIYIVSTARVNRQEVLPAKWLSQSPILPMPFFSAPDRYFHATNKHQPTRHPTGSLPCFENDKQPDHPKTTNTESAFLARAIEQVEKNMHVIGYSVEQLSRDLCMERTGLYRKLVNLLDQSPSLFIRNIRLQRAAQLLTENELSIAEIAERTGFSSSSYLSKCFQEMYGCRPSEYARKTKKST